MYRSVIIGSGGISRNHGQVLSALPDVELCGWADVRLERATERAAQFGGKAYADYKQMLEIEKPDVAHICLPHFLHAPVAIDCMQHGVHVLTEKPMCIFPKDADAMLETAARTGKTLGVIFQNRYNAGSRLAKEALTSGKLGAVIGARAQVVWSRDERYYLDTDWRGRWETEGGGALINQSIHTLDLLRWFLGKATSVRAVFDNLRHPAIEVEDLLTAVIEFENGAVANLYCTTNHTENAPVELHVQCQNGHIDIVGDDATVTDANGAQQSVGRETAEQFKDSPSYWGNSHGVQIRQYYDALTAGQQPEIDGNEGRDTQRLVNAIYEAGRTGKTVKL